MNNIQTFNYESKEVRTIIIDNEPWWIAKEVCEILELTEVSKFMERLDGDEKLIRKIFVSGQNRDIWLINESGLYSLILRSNKPEAKKFKKWITATVLPSIRKTGSYSTPKSDEDIILLGYEKLLAKVKQLSTENETMKPKAIIFDTFMSSDEAIEMGEVAKLLSIGRNTLYKRLRDAKILMGDNIPYQKYMPYFKLIEKPLVLHGKTINVPVPLVKPQGVDYISKKLNLCVEKELFPEVHA